MEKYQERETVGTKKNEANPSMKLFIFLINHQKGFSFNLFFGEFVCA